jgi:TIGR00266 family protein
MEYKILGGNFPMAEVSLQAGESMYTEKGAMAWMSDNISMDTNMKGGFMKGIGRMMSGESLFMATYACTRGQGMVAFGSSFAGEIKAISLGPGQSIICQKDSFLAAQNSVSLAIDFKRKLGAGFFGGEGFIMQRITGPGTVFVEIDGSAVEYNLTPGQVLKVDTGYVAMYESTVSMDITSVSGFKNVLFGGEGLFLTTLRGPGRVWLQTMPLSNFAQTIAARMPGHND